MHLLIVTLGGTISALQKNDEAGVVPQIDGETMLEWVGEAAAGNKFSVESLASEASSNLDVTKVAQYLMELDKKIVQHKYDAVIWVQGTDTLEESAFLAELLYKGDVPFVLTGAMRSPNQAGSDAQVNFKNAVLVATSGKVTKNLVAVTLNDEIFAARFIRKGHTHRVDAFRNEEVGIVGTIREETVRIPLTVKNRISHIVPEGPIKELPEVPLYTTWMGDKGKLLQTIAANNFAGLVIEGLGGGHVPEKVMPYLTEFNKQNPVIVTSRTDHGETLTKTYGAIGSEIDLAKKGIILGGWLSGVKARVLLSLLLAKQIPISQIKEIIEKLKESIY